MITVGSRMQMPFSIATNMTVPCMLYGAMMGKLRRALYPLMMIIELCVLGAPFFLADNAQGPPEARAEETTLVTYTIGGN